MKANISITLEQALLTEIREQFPGQNRSQVIEDALIFWTSQKKKQLLKSDAQKLMNYFTESLLIEDEAISDGLDGL